MKTSSMTAFAAPILCGLLASLHTASAQTSTLTLPYDGIDYELDTYDDADDTTYRVTFTDSGFESIFVFDHDGVFIALVAGNEIYRFLYKNSGLLRIVELLVSRRHLSGKGEGEGDAGLDVVVDKTTPDGGRRLDECYDCEYTWDTLCDQGIETVCDIVSYGDAFSSTAENSIEVFCSGFGGLCDDNTASDVCVEDCGED